jgi:hypothetical protein
MRLPPLTSAFICVDTPSLLNISTVLKQSFRHCPPADEKIGKALILPLLDSDLAGIDEMICQFWHVISHHSTLSSFMGNKMPLGVFIARSRYRQHTEEIYMGKWNICNVLKTMINMGG